MRISEPDLFCPTCRSYVHPFLERCPACGAERAGRFDAILRDPDAGLGLLGGEAPVRANAHEVVLRYTVATGRRSFRSDDSGSASLTEADIRDLVHDIANAIAYRSFGGGPTPGSPVDARLGIADGNVTLRAGRGETLLSVPPGSILAATVVSGARGLERWVGIAFETVEALPRPAIPAGDLLVTFAAGDGVFGQLSLANPRGLFALKARSDHFATLGYWLGLLAAIEAQARWQQVGVAAYAAELGLRAAPPTTTTSGDAVAPASTAGAASVRAALEELEGLRAAGLVSGPEYEEKRREILARL